jgi:hypothetical protein
VQRGNGVRTLSVSQSLDLMLSRSARVTVGSRQYYRRGCQKHMEAQVKEQVTHTHPSHHDLPSVSFYPLTVPASRLTRKIGLIRTRITQVAPGLVPDSRKRSRHAVGVCAVTRRRIAWHRRAINFVRGCNYWRGIPRFRTSWLCEGVGMLGVCLPRCTVG